MEEARDDFPELLADAQADRVVVETFGWQFGTWGGLCTLFSGVVLIWGYEDKDTDPWLPSVSFVLVGLAMVAYEAWRRRYRTALAIKGDAIGIYRRGKLDSRISRNELVRNVIEPMNTAKIVMGLGLFGFMSAFLTVIAPLLSEKVLAIGGTVAIASAIGSSIRTRHFCDIYLIPGKRRGMKWFMVPRSRRRPGVSSFGPR